MKNVQPKIWPSYSLHLKKFKNDFFFITFSFTYPWSELKYLDLRRSNTFQYNELSQTLLLP